MYVKMPPEVIINTLRKHIKTGQKLLVCCAGVYHAYYTIQSQYTVSVFSYFLSEISCTILFKKVFDPVIASGML